jgi:hypothetical protein
MHCQCQLAAIAQTGTISVKMTGARIGSLPVFFTERLNVIGPPGTALDGVVLSTFNETQYGSWVVTS